MFIQDQDNICFVSQLDALIYQILNLNLHILVDNVKRAIAYLVKISRMQEWVVMRQDMDQIDCLVNIWQELVAESVRIKFVKLRYKEFLDVLKFNVQDVKNVCASNVLPIQWLHMILQKRLIIIWIGLMEDVFDICRLYF